MNKAYGEAYKVPEGLLGDAATQPLSLGMFTVIMGLLATLSIYVMNLRKQKILEAAYSKMSIFKKK